MKIVILVRILLSMIHKLSKCNKTKRSLSIWYMKKRARRGWKAKFWKERKEILTLITKFLNKIASKVRKFSKKKEERKCKLLQIIKNKKDIKNRKKMHNIKERKWIFNQIHKFLDFCLVYNKILLKRKYDFIYSSKQSSSDFLDVFFDFLLLLKSVLLLAQDDTLPMTFLYCFEIRFDQEKIMMNAILKW